MNNKTTDLVENSACLFPTESLLIVFSNNYIYNV